jgi:hypothetical protein
MLKTGRCMTELVTGTSLSFFRQAAAKLHSFH